jgi:hypothetical protein
MNLVNIWMLNHDCALVGAAPAIQASSTWYILVQSILFARHATSCLISHVCALLLTEPMVPPADAAVILDWGM